MSEDVSDFKLPAFAPEPPKEAPRKQKKKQELVDVNRLDEALPANIDAEKTILGAVLLDNEAFLVTAERIQPDDFMLESHKRIFLRMRDIMSRNDAVDIVTLAHELTRNKEIEFIGGVSYLASLTEGLPMRPMIDDYIAIVKDKAMLRKMMLISSAAIVRCADQVDPALQIAGHLGAELEEVVSGGMHHGLMPVSEVTVEVSERYMRQSTMTESPGFSWGVEGLDVATGGIQEGEQVVVGCYSGVGKTTLLAQIAAANCSKGRPAAFFLIEPTRHTFLRQLYAIVGKIRYAAVTHPWLATKEERERFHWASNQVLEWDNLHLIDRSNLTLDEQLAMARLAMHRKGVQVFGIDYIQRMNIPTVDKHEDTRLKLGRASIANANLVKNTKCRSVILSQLNRAGSLEALPTMNMLRESGQLENDATTILLLHLKWDSEQGHFTDEGAGILGKQRFGVPCNVKLYKHPVTAQWMSGEKKDHDLNQANLYNED